MADESDPTAAQTPESDPIAAQAPESEPGFDSRPLRREYTNRGLHASDLDPDPIAQISAWIDDASEAGIREPHAMTLATATPHGRPSARTVVLKGLDARGLVFHTNLRSRKGREVATNPQAVAVWYWRDLERQATIEGRVVRVDDAEADALFAARPRGAQMAAHASVQGQPVADRATLERRMADAEAAHPEPDPPRPPWWGAFRIVPDVVEIWQGGADRLHDRLRYARTDDGWRIERLGP